jgi:4'-phosphopantetheinyl transferase EntD
VIARLLPPQVVAVEAFSDAAGPQAPAIPPQEQAVIEKAGAKRRAEFTTARQCARAALARLGEPPVPIPRGERGAPVWPAGIVGSITHCDGYRAAAVARARDLVTLGVDAEPHAVLPGGVLGLIASPAEQAHLASLAEAEPAVGWDRILFSAKESVYKAWFPVARRWLDFLEAEVTIDPAGGTFTARLLVPAPAPDGVSLAVLNGRWSVEDGRIATAIAVRRPHPESAARLPAGAGSSPRSSPPSGPSLHVRPPSHRLLTSARQSSSDGMQRERYRISTKWGNRRVAREPTVMPAS